MQIAGTSREAIKQDPQAALGRVLGLLRSGELPKALALCKHVVATVPGFTDAWLLLCQMQLDIRQPDRALDCVERALALEPGNRKAALLQAQCLIANDEPAAARAALRTLESTSQQQATLLRLVGNTYAGLLDYDDASRCFQRCLSLDADDIEGWHLFSGVLFAQGLLEEAEQALDEVLRLDPRHNEALLTRSSMRRQSKEANHVQQLKELLASDGLDSEGAVMLPYALAKELEDMGEYEESFRYLKQGADNNDSRLDYDVGQDVAFMEALAGVYDRKVSSATGDKTLGEGMVFIVSLPRAGSTLVDRILASHSRVESLGETGAFHEVLLEHARAASAVNKMTFFDAVGCIDYPSLGRDYMGKLDNYLTERAGIIDKTPANVQYLGLIHKALPAAKIVHVHKSPMDACYSIYKTYFSRGYGYSYNLQKLGQYYIAYRHLMDYWRATLPGVFLDVSYEQLVDDQEAQTRRLLEYCGLDWQAQCMDFHLNRSPTATASVVQVRQSLFRSSLDRWRCYGEQLAPLGDILREAGIETG